VDFVIHVFLEEKRVFYDIERLRKSARPMTPAEFDAELKAALAEKTLAVRGKAVKARPKPAPGRMRAKKTVKKAARTSKPKGVAKKAAGAKVEPKKNSRKLKKKK
jgi:ribosome-associated protein